MNGDKRVRSDFTANDEVTQVKGVTAVIIDNLQPMVDKGGDAGRCAKIAQDRYEEACMWATKAMTASLPEG